MAVSRQTEDVTGRAAKQGCHFPCVEELGGIRRQLGRWGQVGVHVVCVREQAHLRTTTAMADMRALYWPQTGCPDSVGALGG